MDTVRLNINRNTLLGIIKQNRTIRTAVEVGTLRGDFAKQICEILQPLEFFAVDPFQLYQGYTDKPNKYYFENQSNLDKLAYEVDDLIRVINQGRQSQLLRMMSHQAVDIFDDSSLDFVYIDADHTYQAVKRDIELWYPKIRDGGILSGHDYVPSGRISFGVIQAVDEFVQQYNLRLAVTSDKFSSWIVCKNNFDIFF